jgi:VWFA-related protein
MTLTRPSHRSRNARRHLLCAALASFALAAKLPAQQTIPGFAEVLDVRVVNVEVVVTDREGNRVPGLARTDFELLVDGKPVAIEFFTEIADGVVTEPAGAARGAERPADVPALGEGQRLRTNIVVFIDDFFSIAQDRDRVLDRLEQDLTQLAEGDRVAIVAFDGTKLDLLTGWTGDRTAIGAALRQARSRRTFGLQRLSERRTNDSERVERSALSQLQIERVLASGGEAPEEVLFQNLDPVELNYVNRLTTQVEHSVLAAVSTLRSFAGPPGRKVMLLLSGGWPYSPAEYALNTFTANVEDTLGAIADTTLFGRSPLFAPLTDTANRLGYTVYPVDLPGLDRESGNDAATGFGELDANAASLSAGGTGGDRELQVHNSLDFLADQTGGRPLINAERDRALSDAIADTRTFYWLGFTPPHNQDDKRHELEVRVKREGLRVRSRAGFVDLSRSAEITMMVESSLLFGDPPSSKPLALRFGQPNRRGVARMRIPLEVGIPMDEIVLIESAGKFRNELELRITVMEPNGERSEPQLHRVVIEGDRPPQPGQMFYYETVLLMREKQHRIVVAVYDPLSGAILSSSGELALP